MAEVVGLVASIVQIAGAGCQLSAALYNYTTSAVRADQDIADIAGDVELTSNALESVGRVFESEEAKSVVSKKAIQDANNLIKRCDVVFKDISELVDKRRKVSKDGKKGLTVMGKLSWPMKEQRLELHRRRLDSLKNSLVLLLHVLQLAQGQARGQLEKEALEKEREKIRELHQRQQDSLKCLQALESKLSKVVLDDEETLQGSAPPSRVPTLELMFGASSATALDAKTVDEDDPKTNVLTIDLSVPDSDTSESDGATTDDDEGEHLSLEDLEKASKHVQKLLKRITVLQKSFEGGHKTKVHKKKHVHKMYARFRKSWETHLGPISIATLPTQTPLSAPVLAPPLFSYHDHHLSASETVELNGRGGYPSRDTDNLTFSQGLETLRSGYNSYSLAPYQSPLSEPVFNSLPDTISSSENALTPSCVRSEIQVAPGNPDDENVRPAYGPPSNAHTLIHSQPPNSQSSSVSLLQGFSLGIPKASSEDASDQQGVTATSEFLQEGRDQQPNRETLFPDLKMGQTDFKARTSPKQEFKKRMAVPGPPLHELIAQQQQMRRERQIAQRSVQTQVQILAQLQNQAQDMAQMTQQRAQQNITSSSLLEESVGSPKSYEQEPQTNISDDAQSRKIRSRIAQRDYRKKLKKTMEDLDRRAASRPASPEHKPVGLQNPQLPPQYEASNMIGLVPVHPYPSAEDRMFSHQYTRQLSPSPKPVTQQAQREFSPHSHGYFVSRIEELVAANMPYAHVSRTPSAADWNEPWLQQRKSPDSQSGHASLADQTVWTAPNRAEHPSHQALSEQHQVYHDNGQGNHALQDYNMQLMLLEQQNKKRLLMARQGQDDLVVERGKGRGDASDRAAGRMSPGHPSAPIPSQANSQNMKRGTEILSQPKDADQIRGHYDMSQTRSERGQPKPVSPNKFAPRDTHGVAEFDGDKSRQVPDMGLSDHAFDLSFGLDEHSALENFDFDSFLQSDQDVAENNVWFGKDFDFSNVASPGKSKEKAEGIAAEGDNKMGDMADARSPVQSASSSGEVLQFSEDVVSPDPGWGVREDGGRGLPQTNAVMQPYYGPPVPAKTVKIEKRDAMVRHHVGRA
ncbi:hypothetical protein FB567DRAFT_589558 [Paraphoma chrysanthemicola]|uniref:Fungal N-terminal domain-containing protein n=1 Tax=Paraphoma chrysanthemicola TaxID=798071 RepID=A0A8K0RCS5_9PLEO|nr:hypothetical protein FB567DRAFT_589558 [Paraphoma chrysanthemicola]